MVAPAAAPGGPCLRSNGGLPALVVILGPTASGKTALSLELARALDGEIVSCDSVAVYRGFDLGTAKPSLAERAAVPHHLIDIASPEHPYTAGAYARDARAALHNIAARGRTPIVTGGTGLYLRALLQGLFPGPQRAEGLRTRLRAIADRRGSAWLHRILRRLDPASSARIHANDAPKIIRAIEVTLTARRPLSQAWQSGRDPLTGFRIVRIGLDPERPQLYTRINARAAQMFEAGLLDETRALLAQFHPTLKVFDSLGYRQAAQHLRGELTREQAIAAAQQGHRNYAKRQLTWFRREPHVHWLHGFGDDPAIAEQAVALLTSQNAIAGSPSPRSPAD